MRTTKIPCIGAGPVKHAPMLRRSKSKDSETPPPPECLRGRLGDAFWERRASLEKVNQSIIRNPSAKQSPFEFLSKSHGLIRAGLLMCGMSGRGRKNARDIRLEEHEVPVVGLPESFDGFRMLHIADMHFGCSAEVTKALIAVVKEVEADLTVCTGDYRFATVGAIDACMEDMRQVAPHLPGPVWSTLGNHDALAMVPELEAMGVGVLINEVEGLVRDGERIWLAGIDDPHHFETDDLAGALVEVPEGDVVVLLAHASERYEQAAAAGVDLYLCGHTHGGQVCLPGGMAVFNHADAPRRFVSGPWAHAGMRGYTSRGSGCTGLEVRFNCPPEVTVHTLRRSSPA